MKDLPIGIQTFKAMREEGFVYVDKTEYVYALARKQTYAFLSRPRRFGKSLLVETFKELFMGSEKLFEGLWIHDKWDWSKTYPVIHLSFDAMNYQGLGLDGALSYELNKYAEKYKIELSEDNYKSQFQELLQKVAEKEGKVVLLIYEYDRPIIDYLEKGDLSKAKESQKTLRTFYSVLKRAEPYLRFSFMTSVSNLSKTFVELNYLDDLTLDKKYASIVGYTQEELAFYFEEHIQTALQNLELTREELLENMRIWYGGFSWDGNTKLYNPNSILKFFQKKNFQSFRTTSDFFKTMKDRMRLDLENIEVDSRSLENNDIENLKLIPFLFQTGYLTVKSINRTTGDIVLDCPNKEVREIISDSLITV
jgi:Predicted AAA-ATPase